jgi:predicted TIM-barrel enzyme
MASTLSNHFKYQLVKKQVDMDADTFKIILMATGFTFNKDTHATLANVSASELANGSGYTTGGIALTNSTVTEDDANDKATTVFDDASWTATGGPIGPTPGAIIFDDTTTDDTVVGYIDFTTERTVADGFVLLIQNINVDLM